MTVAVSIQQGQAEKVLPKGWQWVRLGDICETSKENCDPRKKPDQSFYYIDISSIDNITKQIIEPKIFVGKDAPSRARQIVKHNDVLVSTTRPNLNAVALVPNNLSNQICSTGFCILRPSADLNPYYLFQFVKSSEFVNNLSNLVKGALYPAVTDKQVLTQLIPLPPLEEQKRIVAILNEKMEAISAARTATLAQIEAASALPGAYLRQVFDSPEAQTWERKTLNDLCSDISDGTHFTPEYISNGIPFLSVKNVRETGLIFEGCRYISQEQHQDLCKRCKPERGDILYTKVGTTGIAKAIDIDMEFSIFVSVALLKIKDNILSEYMEKVLNSSICRVQAKNLTQGAANRNLVIQDLKKIIMPVPSIAEQRDIISFLEKHMTEAIKIQKYLESQLEAINALPAAILRQAFNGEL